MGKRFGTLFDMMYPAENVPAPCRVSLHAAIRSVVGGAARGLLVEYGDRNAAA